MEIKQIKSTIIPQKNCMIKKKCFNISKCMHIVTIARVHNKITNTSLVDVFMI